MSSSKRAPFRTELQLLFVVLVWGLNFSVMKIILDLIHPHVANILRIITAGAALIILYRMELQKAGGGFFDPVKKYPWEIFRLGVVGWVLYQIAFVVGLDHTTAGSAAIIMTSLPLWTALLAYLMRIEKLSPLMWTGLFVSMTGTAIVVLSGDQKIGVGTEYLLGNLIVLSASILWSLYTVLNKKLVHIISPLGLTTHALLVSVPFLLAISIPYWAEVQWALIDWKIWLLIIFSGSLSTGIAIFLWNNAVKKIGPSHTAVFQNIVPFVAVIGSFFILGDEILIGQILGGTLTISGLILIRRGRMLVKTETSTP
jgi:drug/metabolite transporter (DMT)-like permease